MVLNPPTVEHGPFLFVPGWGCGEAHAYLPFLEQLALRAKRRVFAIEYTERHVRYETFPRVVPGSPTTLPAPQAWKVDSVRSAMIALGRGRGDTEFHTLAYSEGALHAILALHTLEEMHPPLTLICPAGISPVASYPVIGVRALRNMIDVREQIRTDTVAREHFLRHRDSIRRYLKAGHGGFMNKESVTGGRVDVFPLFATLLRRYRKTETPITIVAGARDAMIPLREIEERLLRVDRWPRVFEGGHSEIFFRPAQLAELCLG